MTDFSPSEIDPLNALAEEFLARHRRGERPDLSEYTARHPDLAERIHDLFPALALMELAPPTRESRGLSDAPLPRQLGEYRLIREVGRGGMGIVYEAVQESLGRRVAIKVLPSSLCHGKYRERFEREAKAAARLHHTNIVPVFGVGEQDGLPYYVMQFIDGRGLDAVLRDKKVPGGVDTPTVVAESAPSTVETPLPAPRAGPDAAYFRDVARLGVQAAEALAYAHAQGVLHRDIKPSNLLVDAQGVLWVADFGLAKANDSADLTEQGDVVGTLRYLAPERFQGQGDARADVYALGVTLYELLTRRPAFEESDRVRLIERVLGPTAPARPRQRMPAIPLDLETIVLKAMAHEPVDRYATAEALAEDLRRFLADRPILARRSSVAERLRRWRRRNPLVAWLTSTVVVLTLLLAFGSTLAAMWLLRALSESETARKDQREQMWRLLIDQARANRHGGRIGQRVESLRLLEEAARLRMTPEIRNEVIACLALSDSAEAARHSGVQDTDTVSFSLDLRRQRYSRSDRAGTISIRALADNTEILHLDSTGKEFPNSASFSPDGRYFVQHTWPDGQLLIWDLADPKPKVVFKDVTGQALFGISFRGDDRQVAVQHVDGSILTYDLAAGRKLHRFPPGSTGSRFAFHPRRPWLAFADTLCLRVANVEDGKEVVHFDLPGSLEFVAWHPDGERLAASYSDHKIYLYDVTAGRPLLTFEGHKNLGIGFSFHPSGQVLGSHDWSGRGRWWDVASGRQLFSARAFHHPWSPGAPPLQAEFVGTELRLHRLVEQRVLRTLAYQDRSRRQRFESARIDAEGRWLAAYTPAGVVLFDLAHPAAPPTVLPKERWPAAFDPSGALLVGSRTDLTRWPLTVGEQKVRIGPPETLYLLPRGEGWSCTADGRLAAIGYYDKGALLFHRDRPKAPLTLGPQGDVRRSAISPNGRWVATSTHHPTVPHAGVKVWEAGSGRFVKDVSSTPSAYLGFSPDSRWLGLTEGRSVRLWRTDSWEEGPRMEGTSFAFGPDGVLAVAQREAICLFDVDRDAEFARLEAPKELDSIPQCFSADGALLVAIGLESETLMIWDLRALREELAARGLDWDRPPYPPAKTVSIPPVRVELVRPPYRSQPYRKLIPR